MDCRTLVIGIAWWALLAGPLGCGIVAGIEDRSLAPPPAVPGACEAATGTGWPDSATRFCTDGDAAIPCMNMTLAAGQDGHVVGALPTYKKTALGETSAGGVHDEITDLVWESDTAALPIPWEEARLRCEKLGGGARLPSRTELVSLVDYGRESPAMNAPTLSAPTSSTDLYWTATTAMDGVWVVGFGEGSITSIDRSLTARARCVVGAARATCLREGDDAETLFDARTGLLWQRSITPEATTWQGALASCASLSTGFRLPSIKELASLAYGESEDASSAAPPFPDGEGLFWSATPVVSAPTEAWFLDGSTGRVEHQTTSAKALVRCVK